MRLRLTLVPGLLLGALPLLLNADDGEKKDDDLLRFSNGDTLHGSFLGMENAGTLKWTGSSIKVPVLLETGSLRQVAFNGGRASKALPGPDYIGLVNGDQIPGRVSALDADTVTIDTPLGETLTVERKFVSSVSPNPFGGSLHYIGPFNEEGWSPVESAPENRPRRVEDGEDPAADEDADEDEEKKDDKEPWVFAGDAWYSNGQKPIALKADIPDRSRVKFKLAWKGRLSAVVAFHATLEVPEVEEEEDEEGPRKRRIVAAGGTSTSSFPRLYGHSYVMTLYSSYAMLYRCDFNEDGSPQLSRLTHSSTSIRLDEAGSATFELRCNREDATITLFANGEYINQWEDPDGFAGIGNHLAFACQSSSSRLRVSDVIISGWNGMPDSARSMDAEERDTILLSNGTDRFSGKIEGFEDGRYTLKGTYATMQIPAAEVEEIRFARSGRAELPETSRKALRVVLRPVGRITVEPTTSSATEMEGRHPALGDLKFDLRYASLLEFSPGTSILDFWDDDF